MQKCLHFDDLKKKWKSSFRFVNILAFSKKKIFKMRESSWKLVYKLCSSMQNSLHFDDLKKKNKIRKNSLLCLRSSFALQCKTPSFWRKLEIFRPKSTVENKSGILTFLHAISKHFCCNLNLKWLGYRWKWFRWFHWCLLLYVIGEDWGVLMMEIGHLSISILQQKC